MGKDVIIACDFNSKEQVMINGEVYFVGNTAIADYLGYNVENWLEIG